MLAVGVHQRDQVADQWGLGKILKLVLCWVAPEGVYFTLITAAVPESSTVPRLAAVIEYVPVPVRVIEKLVPVGLEVTDG